MKVQYKIISLRPYPGEIKLFRDLTQFRAYYENKTGNKYDYGTEKTGGQYIRLDGNLAKDHVWMIYARQPHVLAHEVTHVLLQIFNTIGAHPADGNGEPFCYMLSQIMLDAKSW